MKYKCEICRSFYPSVRAIAAHNKKYHPDEQKKKTIEIKKSAEAERNETISTALGVPGVFAFTNRRLLYRG